MMRAAILRDKWWLTLNALAIAAYLMIASATWHEPDGFDLAVTRSVSEMPLLLVVGVVDAVWFGLTSIKAAQGRSTWISFSAVLLALGCWVAAYCIDRSQWGA